MPDRIRGVAAIAEHLIVGVVPLDDLILLEGEQQVQKRRRWNVETLDRGLNAIMTGWRGWPSCAQQFLCLSLQQIEHAWPPPVS